MEVTHGHTTLISTDMPHTGIPLRRGVPNRMWYKHGVHCMCYHFIWEFIHNLKQLAFIKISVGVWVILYRFEWFLDTVNSFKSRVWDFLDFWCRAFGFCGFGIWDSVGFGFRIFGDLGIGGNELVNGLGNYGIGE